MLVSLRTVGDNSTSRFMKRFYAYWLGQPAGVSDPVAAIQLTRDYFDKHDNSVDWTPYVLIGI